MTSFCANSCFGFVSLINVFYFNNFCLLLKFSANGIKFDFVETMCGIAYTLGILVMNSCDIYRYLQEELFVFVVCSLNILNIFRNVL